MLPREALLPSPAGLACEATRDEATFAIGLEDGFDTLAAEGASDRSKLLLLMTATSETNSYAGLLLPP